MKIRTVMFAAILSCLVAPIGVHAQLRGMLKKKADEVLKGKPSAPAPTESGKDAPPPTSTPAPTSAPTTTASPAPRAADAKTPPKPAADPLDVSQMNLQSTANQTLRGEMQMQKGDWEGLPYINQKTVAAAKALDDTARVTFVQTLGAAFKSLVMSDTYQTSHAAYVKSEFKGVDHGIKGLVSLEDLMKRNNTAAFEAAMNGQQAVAVVDSVESMSAEDIQRLLDDDLKGWSRRAAEPTRKDRAKYQKVANDGQALKALGATDVAKLRRGYAVLRSADNGGLDTEAALYAQVAKVRAETEQIAFDQHNLKSVLKQQLTAFVAIVPTVDFAAVTTRKGSSTVFVNPAFEAKGQVWKACFRAGRAPSMAALSFAQAWLKEL